jgi:hypothetical protein
MIFQNYLNFVLNKNYSILLSMYAQPKKTTLHLVFNFSLPILTLNYYKLVFSFNGILNFVSKKKISLLTIFYILMKSLKCSLKYYPSYLTQPTLNYLFYLMSEQLLISLFLFLITLLFLTSKK